MFRYLRQALVLPLLLKAPLHDQICGRGDVYDLGEPYPHSMRLNKAAQTSTPYVDQCQLVRL